MKKWNYSSKPIICNDCNGIYGEVGEIEELPARRRTVQETMSFLKQAPINNTKNVEACFVLRFELVESTSSRSDPDAGVVLKSPDQDLHGVRIL